MKPRRQTVEGEGYLHARLVFFIFSQSNSIKRTILLSFKKFKSFYERQRYYPQEKQCQVFTVHNLSPKATFPYIAGIETRTRKEQLKWVHKQNSHSDERSRRLHAYKQFPQLDTQTRGSLLPIPYVQSHYSKKTPRTVPLYSVFTQVLLQRGDHVDTFPQDKRNWMSFSEQ